MEYLQYIQESSTLTNTSKAMHCRDRQRYENVPFTKSLLVIFMTLMLILPQTFASDPCTTADFPKLFGSLNADNNFLQIDAHLEKNAICAVGDTRDNQFTGSYSASFNPIIVCYQGFPNYPYKWGKWADVASLSFAGIQFSGNGELLIVHSVLSGDSIVAVFDFDDGTLMKARKFPDSDGYNRNTRNMLIDSDGYAYISKQNSLTQTNRIFKFDPLSSDTSIIWGIQTTAFIFPMGLEFLQYESSLIALTGQEGFYTTYIKQLKTADGNVDWAYSFNAQNSGTQSLACKQLSLSRSMIFAGVGQPGASLTFAKVILDSGASPSGTVYSSTLAVEIKALYIVDELTVKALLFGTMNSMNQVTAIATLNLGLGTNNVVQVISTPPIITGEITAGRFVTQYQFYLGGYITEFDLDYHSLHQNFVKRQGIIISSDSTISCMAQGPVLSSTLLTTAGSLTKVTVLSTTFTIITTTYSATIYSTLVMSGLTPTTTLTDMAFCARPNSATYTLYEILPVAQTTTSLMVEEGKTFIQAIDQFETKSTPVCGSTTPTWSYFLEDSPGSFLTVDSNTGSISVNTNSIVGTYDFKVKGKLQNGQYYSEEFNLVITPAVNLEPTFASPISNMNVNVFSTTAIKLPAFSDPEGKAVTIKFETLSNPTLPSFMLYSNANNELQFSNAGYADIGSFTITATLSDGVKSTIQTFQVYVINMPPEFSPPIDSNMVLPLNTAKSFTISDPEAQPVTATSTERTMTGSPSFISQVANDYVIKATTFSELGPHTVDVKLDDGGTTQGYSFTVTFTNTAPTFTTALVNQIVSINQILAYTLPSIIDAEGNSFTVTTSCAFCQIVTSGGISLLQIKATDFSLVKDNSIIVKISDGNLASDYPMTITVTNSAPYFLKDPIDQTLALNQQIIYPLPPFQDDEGNSVYISISPSTSFVSFDNPSTLKINPNSLSDVGTNLFQIILEDGQPLKRSYPLKIQVTNTAPSFSADIKTDFTLKVSELISYPLPSWNDPEGDIVTISLDPVKDFVKIQTGFVATLEINPTIEQQAGVYNIKIKLSDGQLFNEYPITISVQSNLKTLSNMNENQQTVPFPQIQGLVNSGPPIFETPLEAINLKIDSPLTYFLPSISNPDSDEFEIQVNIQDCLMFAKYDSTQKSLSFNLKNQFARIKPYVINIVITDKNPIWPKSSHYTLYVYTPAPITKQEEIKNNLNNTLTKMKNITTETARLKLLRASKDGMLYCRIVSNDQDATTMLAKQLNQSTDLMLYLRSYGVLNSEINFEIDKSTIDTRSGGYFSIKMNFDDPATVSIDKELDQMILRVMKDISYTSNQRILTLPKNSQAQIQVPQQLTFKMTYLKQQIGPAVKSLQIAVLPISITLSLILQIFLNFVWGLLNDLTLLMSLAMVAVPVPGLTQTFMSIILKFIYLDLLQTDLWMSDSFHLNKDSHSEEDDQSLSPYFKESGFQSKSILKNLGSTLIYLIALFVAYFILSVVSLFDFISNKLTNISSKLKSILMWNFGIRFIIQQFQPLMLSSLINFYDFYTNEASDLSFANAAFALGCIVGIQAIIITLARVLNKSKVQDEDFKKKYGTLTEGNRTTNVISKYWTIFILLKWTILSVVLVALRDHSEFQIFTLLGLTLTSQILILQGRPHQEPSENLISLFNDLMAQVYLYFLLILTLVNDIDSTGDSEEEILKMVLRTREMIGVALLTVVFFTFAVNICKFFASLYKGLLEQWKKRKLLKQKGSVVKMLPTSPPPSLMDKTNNTSLSLRIGQNETFYRSPHNSYQGHIKVRQNLRRQHPDPNPYQQKMHERALLSLSQDQTSIMRF